ncbi:hypothetical protein GIW81_03675 [Hyphomicrobium sp. xq]|uniref:DUF3325 domain-containing protein n=1 Tax=Hyphomicrobium album TaxID=2665159 RepID=A0A6I3KD99_9HYPH|nr:hypothetical protein [Hyphomicrobium album]MTD93435.1 hypothetical protein [Hyphomicrobium album]
MIDQSFLLAVGAIGWGLSLATYRPLALKAGWPLGKAQERVPALTLVVAVVSIAAGLIVAGTRGALHGGVAMVLLGIALAVFWSGFLRVGAQSALFLAPLAALTLALCWLMAAAGL